MKKTFLLLIGSLILLSLVARSITPTIKDNSLTATPQAKRNIASVDDFESQGFYDAFDCADKTIGGEIKKSCRWKAQTAKVARSWQYVSNININTVDFEVHHDHITGTNKPIEVYIFAGDWQWMDRNGLPQPEGFLFATYMTKDNLFNDTQDYRDGTNGKDCVDWFIRVSETPAEKIGNKMVYPYFYVQKAQGARTISTIEDGEVTAADDVQCWGSRDTSPPH